MVTMVVVVVVVVVTMIVCNNIAAEARETGVGSAHSDIGAMIS